MGLIDKFIPLFISSIIGIYGYKYMNKMLNKLHKEQEEKFERFYKRFKEG